MLYVLWGPLVRHRGFFFRKNQPNLSRHTIVKVEHNNNKKNMLLEMHFTKLKFSSAEEEEDAKIAAAVCMHHP